MPSNSLTVAQTIDQLREALRDYVEAAYHISHPALIGRRRRLLDEPVIIHQKPYIESTPRYETGEHFENLGLDPAALEMFSAVSQPSNGHPKLIYDPPYVHQETSIRRALVEEESLLVMTGTGSGKTECFLLPILGKLAKEAKHRSSFGQHDAVRAILLYPMNALVNDQLGRLRQLFGDPRVADRFMEWGGRPARFARYTSRTLYPGVRTKEKDQGRLRPIKDFYIHLSELVNDGDGNAERLVEALKEQGKWPAKPDLRAWYGQDGSRWQDAETGAFQRCVTQPSDPELLTRHEVLAAPPDVLVTNYSMLEYMMMRPIERPVFDKTSRWLDENPDEKLLLVVDEAHLYRGASGAEVALLLRRLRERLGISEEQMQVVCTSASFEERSHAKQFGADLTGKSPEAIRVVAGDLKYRQPDEAGAEEDAEALAAVDLDAFHNASSLEQRLKEVEPFLEYRGVEPEDLQRSLHEALKDYAPMSRVVNRTMEEAMPPGELASVVFEGVNTELAEQALTVLMTLGSVARESPQEPGLLPCRVHAFFRGLPGLWICPDPECSALPEEERGDGPAGKLYGQPQETCDCSARIFELYTCRNCGSAYARAYTDDLEWPTYLWAEAGKAFRTTSGNVTELHPLDLLLEEPRDHDEAAPAELDLLTGRLNPQNLGERWRTVYLPADRDEEEGNERGAAPGQFRPCPTCGDQAGFGRSSVQDHLTKGDQPFQAVVTKQIEVQPPGPKEATRFAPLRGRKVLVFSDSRQTAARLAPQIQTYSTRDALRPLILKGFTALQGIDTLASLLSLDDVYLATLVGASQLGVRLRPELKESETFDEAEQVRMQVDEGVLDDTQQVMQLWSRMGSTSPPQALLRNMVAALVERYYGMEALALATVVEQDAHTDFVRSLPDIEGVATMGDEKAAVVRTWLSCWAPRPGIWFDAMDDSWWQRDVRGHKGGFRRMNRNVLRTKEAKRAFRGEWLPDLLSRFAEPVGGGKYRLKSAELSLRVGGSWAYCEACRSAQRPFPGSNRCTCCGEEEVREIDPDTDPVFTARKRFYRQGAVRAMREGKAPKSIIAAEHTAQLNTAQYDEVFSTAEEHELLFQDIDVGEVSFKEGRERRQNAAVDVLSCTTTMEVGIDIGSLSGVALRNIPPGRANYQQRAGRAGRRGNAIATVVAFGSSDSHDEHFFREPGAMIRGAVQDPTITLSNTEIAKRHVVAYLLQRYHRDRLPSIPDENQPNNLFEVLGSVGDFLGESSELNRADFEQWLGAHEEALRGDVDNWLPETIAGSARSEFLRALVPTTLRNIDEALRRDASGEEAQGETSAGEVPQDQRS